MALDAAIGGTVAAPQVNGTVTLAGGEIEDFTQGVHLTDLAATLQASGQTIRIASFTGHAGAGTIGASGSIGLQGAMPIDIVLTMRNARALASDRLTADLDADLTLRGDVQGALAASGTIAIQRATINIPEHLPSSVAVLNVRLAGQKPPPPPAPGATIRLDLTLTTPGQIFVRGRGLDAVLGGTLHVAGTSAAPQLSGGFQMARGTFSLAGTTLNFTRGKVGFDGTGATHKIDPSLDFEADVATTNSSTVDATGRRLRQRAEDHLRPARRSLPQDEVLSQLLFGQQRQGPWVRSNTRQIVAALADLTGTTNVGQPAGPGAQGAGAGPALPSAAPPPRAARPWPVRAARPPRSRPGRYVANGVYVGAKQGTSRLADARRRWRSTSSRG